VKYEFNFAQLLRIAYNFNSDNLYAINVDKPKLKCQEYEDKLIHPELADYF
jgi:hypothetical protein